MSRGPYKPEGTGKVKQKAQYGYEKRRSGGKPFVLSVEIKRLERPGNGDFAIIFRCGCIATFNVADQYKSSQRSYCEYGCNTHRQRVIAIASEENFEANRRVILDRMRRDEASKDTTVGGADSHLG